VKSDPLPASIEHCVAELRARYPRLTFCRAALEHWAEDGAPRYALGLDIRWPQHQSLIVGPAQASAESAVAAAFELAAHRVERRHA
jgi:hypothetical protein